MGTRSILQIKLDGKIYLQQYNQWDGYPKGLGRDIRDFIVNWFGVFPEKTKAKYKLFVKHLRNSRMVSEAEYSKLMGETSEASLFKRSKVELMQVTNYQLTRDCAENVFWYIVFTEKPILAIKDDMADFAFRYVLDLDEFILSIFYGKKKMGKYKFIDLSNAELDLLQAEYEERKIKRKVKGTVIELNPTYVVVALKGGGKAVCHGSRLGGNKWGFGYDSSFLKLCINNKVEMDIAAPEEELLLGINDEEVEWEILKLKKTEDKKKK